MQNAHFTPPQLAPLFGVNVSTIKRWAEKGYLPTHTTPGGHRRISKDQLSEFITKYPKHAKNSYVLKRLLKKDYCPDNKCWKQYYQYLKHNDNTKAIQLLEKQFLSGASIINILKTIITPTLRHLGQEWTKNNITVFDEHRISFNMRVHLMRLDQLIPDKTTNKSLNTILACAPGEYHELPLQLVALIFKLNGWYTHILGVNIKIVDLLKTAKKIKPEVIVISKTYTKKTSAAYFNKLGSFMDENNICIAMGGGAWEKETNSKFVRNRKCAKYFPALKLFSDFLADYKRK
ncbi:MAG: helix-turn-helix domain-containing protein [Candidatus Kerfeldbacteria bacterium]|jgi:excisionase family DNA binding protein